LFLAIPEKDPFLNGFVQASAMTVSAFPQIYKQVVIIKKCTGHNCRKIGAKPPPRMAQKCQLCADNRA
jgi:hypothetical protein